MRCITVILVVLFINCANSYSPWASWKSRMKNYGALVNCEYYLTSENAYKDYLKINFEYTNNITQFRIHSLSQNAFKFLVSDANYDNPTGSLNYEIVIGESSDGGNGNGGNSGNGGNGGDCKDGCAGPPGENGGNAGKDGDDNDCKDGCEGIIPAGILVVSNNNDPTSIGDKVSNKGYAIRRDRRSSNGNMGLNENYVLSYVQRGGKRLKTLATPEIIRKDQPNEILVELHKEGNIRVTINENTPLEIKAEAASEMKYVSFAASKNNRPEEFFYNCASN